MMTSLPLRCSVALTVALVAGCDKASAGAATPQPSSPAPAAASQSSAAAPTAHAEPNPNGKVVLKTEGLTVLTPPQVQAPAVAKALRGVIDAYLTLKDAFITKDVAKVRAAALPVQAAVQAVPAQALKGDAAKAWESHRGVMLAALTSIGAEASDLKAQRLALSPLSDAAYAAARSFKMEGLFAQHCPMANRGAGGNWLSAAQAIRNPYYGDEMLECGEVQEVL